MVEHGQAADTNPLSGQQLTAFVGRAEHLAAVGERLCRPEVRLVTLTGPGGVGKTRLALQVAAGVEDTFADGYRVVSLAEVRSAAAVLPAIAYQLGLPEGAAERVLHRAFDGRELLLVLDNLEHLTAAASDIAGLLQHASGLTVLATSRSPLDVRGEHVYPVPPMTLPPEGRGTRDEGPGDRLVPRPSSLVPRFLESEAVALFLERGRAVRPDLELTAENGPLIAEICARLDGLPLAIELAAARLRVLSPQALLGQLSHRFTLLTGGPRDVPARQQTIRDTIAWSYDLLTPERQAAFRRLSVFVGGFTLEAAEAFIERERGEGGEGVRGPSLSPSPSPPRSPFDIVGALIDQSLVQAGNPDEVEPRYRLLETVREFGLEQLAASGEEAETRALHAGWFVGLAERAEPELEGAEQFRWLDRLEADYDNIRAAQDWILANGAWKLGLRLARSLFVFWQTRNHIQAETAWVERLMEIVPETDEEEWAVRTMFAFNTLGTLLHLAGDYPAARRRWEECLARSRALGHQVGEASALNNLAMLATDTGDFARGSELYAESVRLSREIGDRGRLARILHNYTIPLTALGRADEVWEILQEVRELLRDGSDPRMYGYCLNSLGDAAWWRGDAKLAAQLFDEALELIRQTGNERAVAVVLLNMSRMALAAHQHARAAAYMVEALSFGQVRVDRREVADLLDMQAAVLAGSGQAETGARLLGAADAIRDEVGSRPEHPEERERTVAAIVAALGRQAADDTRAVGRGLPIERAIDLAIAAVEPLTAAAGGQAQSVQTVSPAAPVREVALTRRERDVLRLLAEGRSDREIAEALFLSHRTVSTHVSNILGKLDVATRSAAASYAVRAGVV